MRVQTPQTLQRTDNLLLSDPIWIVQDQNIASGRIRFDVANPRHCLQPPLDFQRFCG